MTVDTETLDVTDLCPGAARAARKGVNTLILRKLNEPYQIPHWENGTRRVLTCPYELEYRWHKTPDADINAVQGNDFIYLTDADAAPVLTGNAGLFEAFQLF